MATLADGTKRVLRTDRLFCELKGEILNGRLQPGDRLSPEKDLAERHGVSRTVVREAVARLAARGFVDPRHGSGVYVSHTALLPAFEVSPQELAELGELLYLLELRMPIEAEAARLAALRRRAQDVDDISACLEALEASATPDEAALSDAHFHRAIARASGNPYYERMIDFFGPRLVPSRSLMLNGKTAAAQQSYARIIANEHVAIFEAISDGDPDGAARAARAHMELSLQRHAALG